MGNNYSTHNYQEEVTEVLDNIKTKITANMTSTCNSSSSNVQTMTFGNVKAENCSIRYGDINQGISTKVTATCIQNENFKQMLDDVVNEEMAELRKQSKPVLAANIQKIIDEEVNVEKVSECVADILSSQNMHFGDVTLSCPSNGRLDYDNISQQLASDLVFTCVKGESPDILDILDNIVIPPHEKFDFSHKKNSLETKEKEISDEMMTGIISGSVVGFLVLLCFILGMVYLYKKPSV